jgi:hypothetical protein
LAAGTKTGDNRQMARLPWVLVLLALAAPAPALADVLRLYGEAHGGGMFGHGTAGDLKETAFFQQARGGAYGAAFGARFLILDGRIQHHQYVNGDGLKTWTSLHLGVGFTLEAGSEQEKKAGKGAYLEMGGGIAFGVGTGAQVELPLDNGEITDKALLGEARIGFGTHLSRRWDLGVSIPITYGYFIKSGHGAFANDVSTHYRGVHAEALLVLRMNLRLL